ncbi:MAG: secondary thiamine-phosphate synthase enzyme YjbQ [Planctomycetota bacterium]|jgi:secondary thiamine-phosphate synthase enzyme
MEILTEIIPFETKADFDVVDITDRVDRIATSCHCEVGFVNLFAVGATVSLTTVEYEPGLVADLAELFDTIAPQEKGYKHNEKWQDGNGHSHVRASLVGPSLVVPLLNGRMVIGQWQHIVFLDFDVSARRREVICQVIGEGRGK